MNDLLQFTGAVNKRNTSFYLTEETHTLIRRLAQERGTSKNQIVEAAIRELSGGDRQQVEDEPNLEANKRLEDMRDQVEFLRRELERKDAILLSLTQRVPELEPSRAEAEVTQREESRPWWSRLLRG